MAVMQRCCCCGVRPGSIACAIYSLVIACAGIGLFTYNLLDADLYRKELYELKQQAEEQGLDIFGDLNIDAYVCALKVEYIFALVFLLLVSVTSIVMIIGIIKDTKGMLVPFMLAKSLGFVWYLFAIALASYAMAMMGTQYAGAAVIGLLIVLVPFLIADIVCLLCVLSQYQELRDGRGRFSDQPGTTVIVQQTVPVGSGGFAYRQMQHDPPPAYGSPVPTKPDVL